MTEIEQAQKFIRIVSKMTDRQLVFLSDYMDDLAAKRSTAKSKAKLEASFRE